MSRDRIGDLNLAQREVSAAQFSRELASKMSEWELQEHVQDLLTIYGWRWTHFRPARSEKGWRTALSGSPGFFDLVATRPPRLLFIELKSERGKLTHAQQDWLRDLRLCQQQEKRYDGPVIPELPVVWRPSDWLDGTIERMLR